MAAPGEVFQIIDGEIYNQQLIDKAKSLVESTENGMLGMEDAKELWTSTAAYNAEDVGAGKDISEVDLRTIEKVVREIKLDPMAKMFLSGVIKEAKKDAIKIAKLMGSPVRPKAKGKGKARSPGAESPLQRVEQIQEQIALATSPGKVESLSRTLEKLLAKEERRAVLAEKVVEFRPQQRVVLTDVDMVAGGDSEFARGDLGRIVDGVIDESNAVLVQFDKDAKEVWVTVDGLQEAKAVEAREKAKEKARLAKEREKAKLAREKERAKKAEKKAKEAAKKAEKKAKEDEKKAKIKEKLDLARERKAQIKERLRAKKEEIKAKKAARKEAIKARKEAKASARLAGKRKRQDEKVLKRPAGAKSAESNVRKRPAASDATPKDRVVVKEQTAKEKVAKDATSIKTGVRVVVAEHFVSNDKSKTDLARGLGGVVKDIADNGSAKIKFDDMAKIKIVKAHNFDKLKVGKATVLKAPKAASKGATQKKSSPASTTSPKKTKAVSKSAAQKKSSPASASEQRVLKKPSSKEYGDVD